MNTYGFWNEPVELQRHGIGQYETISNTREAMNCLMGEWPSNEGNAFEFAVKSCTAVLDERADPMVARDAFIKAAHEAGIYMKPY